MLQNTLVWGRRLVVGESREQLIEKLANLDASISVTLAAADLEEKQHSENLDNNRQSIEEEQIEPTLCLKRTGVVTFKDSVTCVIDNVLAFDDTKAGGLWEQLKVLMHIEYLAYVNPNTNVEKILKVYRIVDENWSDPERNREEEIKRDIEILKKEQPTYFKIITCTLPGIIVERKPTSIIVDIEKTETEIGLEDAIFDFVPEKGDHVLVVCQVQKDPQFVDKCGEIVIVEKVTPSRRLVAEGLKVTRLHGDWGVLDNHCFFSYDTSPLCETLAVGSFVKATIIENEWENFVWRAIELKVENNPPVASIRKENLKKIIVQEKVTCSLQNLDETKEVTIKVKNQTDSKCRCILVESSRSRGSQLTMLDPAPETGFELESGAEYLIRIKVTPQRMGWSNELITICFHNFNIKRTVGIRVGPTEVKVDTPQPGADQDGLGFRKGAVFASQQRMQAQQVYANNKYSIVCGGRLHQLRRFVAKQMPPYKVPDMLRNLWMTFEPRIEIRNELKSQFPELQEELSAQNYANRLQYLIFIEELENMVLFRRYDRDRAHFERNGEYLSLKIENLAECRPSLVIGDTLHAHDPFVSGAPSKGSIVYEGVIHKVLFDRILLKFRQSFQEKYNGEDYRLEFFFSRFNFRKAHHAVRNALKVFRPDFLFPAKVLDSPDLQLNATLSDDGDFNLLVDNQVMPWYNPSLNEIQKFTVRNILRGEARSLPYVIFGPPGTGKTITVVETILQLTKLMPGARLLVATPSNSAANLITSRLIDSGALMKGEFTRLVSNNAIEKELIPAKILEHCITVDIGIDGTFQSTTVVTESGLTMHCTMKTIGRHRITISTCASVGVFFLMGFPPDHFTHVIVDEAGQCTEPDVMIPITQVSKKNYQVILAGDANQLPPVVLNIVAKDLDYDLSFLERILRRLPYTKDMKRFPNTCGYDARLLTKLLHSYRALPSILYTYNHLFYHNELRATISDKDSREADLLEKLVPRLNIAKSNCPAGHGTFFRGVIGENKQDSDSPSWYNAAEANEIFVFVLKLYNNGVKADDIGIITPYIKQVRSLRVFFQSSSLVMPKIGTVEEFQGQERDYIFVSTVRSNYKLIETDLVHALGFVRCPKRMNVAISRARVMQVVVGNPYLLSKDGIWNYYLKYCLDNDAYTGCDISPLLEEQMQQMP